MSGRINSKRTRLIDQTAPPLEHRWKMKHILITTIAAVLLIGVGRNRQTYQLPRLLKMETSEPSNSTWLLERILN